MPWLTYREALEATGHTPGQLKRRAADGRIRFEADPERPRFRRYWIEPAGRPAESATPRPAVHDSPADFKPPSLKHNGESWTEREGYVYDGSRRVYVLSVSTQRAPLVLSRERVEAIWSSYAGSGATIAEICREFALSRTLFGEIKRCLGLTKTRAPWPDEVIEETSEGALIEDATRAKERRVLAKVERREWEGIKRIAEKRRHLRAIVQDAFADGGFSPPAIPVRVQPNANTALVVGWSDIHVGKRTHGESGDLDAQGRELLSLIADIVRRARQSGPLRAIYVPIGSDLLHADNTSLTTTKGTPQGSQSVGSVRQHLRLARDLTAALIDGLAQIAPVVAFSLPGNHDETLTDAVALALEERYRATTQVQIDTSERRRKTFAFGTVPLIFSHGDKIKSAQIPLLVARETPQGCDVRQSVVFRGHIHTASSKRVSDGHEEIGGFDVVQMASPSHADDWHHESLYDLNQRRLTLALVADGQGLERVEWARCSAA